MRLTKDEKEILMELVQNEIATLTEIINEEWSPAMDFRATKEYIEELENILKKLKGEG